MIIKLSSFTVSIIAMNFALQTQHARADANDDYYTQSRELMKKGKYTKEAGAKIYQNTLIKARTKQVNEISANNTAHFESLKNYAEKHDVEEKVANSPGSKENPFDKKTGLSKLDKKPMNAVNTEKTAENSDKAPKKVALKKETPRTESTTSAPSIKVDDSNLPSEMSFPGTDEGK